MALKSRKGFTLVELLVVIAIIAILVALLLPAVNAAREAARRNGCTNNARQIALAILNHESATQRLPAATDNRTSNGANSYTPLCATEAGQGGYSWMVKTLPYIEESALYDNIAQNSRNFNTSPSSGLKAFDEMLVMGDPTEDSGALEHASVAQMTILQCPSFSGAYIVQNPQIYNNVSTNVAIGNYASTSGTHFLQSEQDGQLVQENGAMISGFGRRGKGRRIGELADGASKTTLLAESKEEGIASWYGGESAWVTAMYEGVYPDPNDPKDNTGLANLVGANGGLPSTGHALNYGSGENEWYSPSYAQGTTVTDQPGRRYGPSSDHTGSIVVHAFADGHVTSKTQGSDARIIYAIYSTNEGESVSENEG